MRIWMAAVLIWGCLSLAGQGMAQSVSYVGANTQNKEQTQKQKKTDLSKIECGTPAFPMRVATVPTNPPFGWVDILQADKYQRAVNVGQGFSIELIKKVCDDLGIYMLPVGFETYPETLRALNQGTIDLFVGAYYDTRFIRTGNIFVTPGFFKNIVLVIFPKGKEKKVDGFDDLIGLKGVVRKDEEFYSLIYRGLPEGLDIRQVDSAQEAFTLLMTGEVDYLLGSPYAAEAEARRLKIENDIVYSEKSLAELEMFLVFSPNTKCLPLRQKIVEQLRLETQDSAAIRNRLIDQINAWGQRFAKEKGLLEEDDVSEQAIPVGGVTEALSENEKTDINSVPTGGERATENGTVEREATR